ncbi:ABC transporter ATP-binding protein [Rhodobium gokarnense]|uniref:ABC-type branched-subunit amino acid transport system ATPase component n=1 Tax=Rhodobium gokarnense TaxID=364296 RepID=A0ABT3H913_9HYPH|nr:ABC transporter ATP-binding protein [Rhodobium gokarnense]MCW2306897.1 ABC-type branched-subunit amino acid transport system ATPase component [Rhodobium gokarnense]
MTTLLKTEDLLVQFGGLKALDRLSVSFDAGAIVGVIGPNGSGKTTFFNAITGLYQPTSGTIVLDGEDITDLPTADVFRHGVSRTFQRCRLCLDMSVVDNVMVGRHHKVDAGFFSNVFRRSRYRKSLKESVEVSREALANFSGSLAENLFEPVSKFNMIDRRRIEVCRALVAEPKLLLLDEPAAGMTLDETREFMDDILRIRDLYPRMTIVIIEHEMDVMQRVAETCVVLSFGRKISEGPFEQVIADPWVQEAYLGKRS